MQESARSSLEMRQCRGNPPPPPKRKPLYLFPRTQNKDLTALRPQRRAGSNIRSPGGVFRDCPLRQRKSDRHVQKCSRNPVKPGETSHLCRRNVPLKKIFFIHSFFCYCGSVLFPVTEFLKVVDNILSSFRF
jgi:hypothetical protein